MRKYTLLLFTILLAIPVFAQTKQYGNDPAAENIVRAAVDNLSKNTYSSRFSLEYYIDSEEKTESQMGAVDMKGRFFRIQFRDTEIKFNGKTQWNYVASDNEVTITQPSQADLNESNPMSMIQSTLTATRLISNDKRVVSGCYVIHCIPNEPKKVEYFKITLYIDTKTNLPRKIILHQRNGDKITMSFLDLHKVQYNAKLFVFNKAEYPNVTMNDLR